MHNLLIITRFQFPQVSVLIGTNLVHFFRLQLEIGKFVELMALRNLNLYFPNLINLG